MPHMPPDETPALAQSNDVTPAWVLDVGSDLGLLVPHRSRQIALVEARARQDGIQMCWRHHSGLIERIDFSQVELPAQRRLWYLLNSAGTPLFALDDAGIPHRPASIIVLGMLYVDRLQA